MRVLIDTSFAARGPSGTAVYIERLTEALRARGNVEVVEARRRRRPAPGRSRQRGRVLWSAVNALLDVALAPGLAQARARAARAPTSSTTRCRRGSWRAPCAQAITVHDLAFEHLPEGFGRIWRLLARRRHRAAARRAARGRSASRARRPPTPSGSSAPTPRTSWSRRTAPARRCRPARRQTRQPQHFLYVGDDEPRKRVPALLEAHRRYAAGRDDALPLVLAGSAAARANGRAAARRRAASRTPRGCASCWPARRRWCTRPPTRASA